MRPLLSMLMVCASITGLAQEGSKDAKALVKRAVAFYQEKGREALVKEVSAGAGSLRDGALYLFVYDLNGLVVAHGQIRQLIGANLFNAKDPSGKFYVQERIALVKEKGSGWQDYTFKDPATQKVAPKRAYLELVDGLIIGCGSYRP